MKRVTFETAKALKEAGYTQNENEELKMRGLPERVDTPTYLEDFEKKHKFYEVTGNSTAQTTIDGKKATVELDKLHTAIDAALEYLSNEKK